MDKESSSFLFHDLPDSIILQIFCKFTIKERLLLRRVCWKWHHLLNDYSVWKSIDLSEDSALKQSQQQNSGKLDSFLG